MDPVTVGLATNLLAAGLMKGSAEAKRLLYETDQLNEFSTELDAVETEFNRALQSSIEDVDAGSEADELTVEENWDAIVRRLYGLDDDTGSEEGLEDENASERLVFESEEDAVERIACAIAVVNGYGFDENENPELERNLKRGVTVAYREAVDSFVDRIIDAGLVESFVVEMNIEEIEELDRLRNRLDELKKRFTQPKFYYLFTGDEDGHRRASKVIESQTLEFVSRPKLEESDSDSLLLLGPGGSGKSRALAELVATYDRDVEHVIVPRAPLQNPQDLQPLQHESFNGDVLLVWDDIHDISPETGNTIFRKIINELEDLLPSDHNLYVLAAARINKEDQLPGDVRQSDSSLWSGIEVVEFESLSEGAIETLFDLLC